MPAGKTGRRPARAAHRAFTLIELLVVVAIIALLISILLPSLARARDQGESAVCKANLHQIGLALTMYTLEEGFYPSVLYQESDYPPAVKDIGGPVPEPLVLWPTRLLAFVKGQQDVFWCPSAPADTHWDGRKWIVTEAERALNYTWAQGSFAYGYNDWGIFDIRWLGLLPDGYELPQGMALGLGAYIPKNPNNLSVRHAAELKASLVKQPSEMIAIGDTTSDGYFDTVFDPTPRDSPSDEETGANEEPGNRHSGGANVLFCDGHVQWFRQPFLMGYLDEYKNQKPTQVNPQARLFNRDNKPHYELLDLVPYK
jgi:prepilin-type processing-associated H-X9-DG protein/prepilin-type N-terminal cleavage/methylation domain-containing protein